MRAQHLPASRFCQAAEDGLSFVLVVATEATKPSLGNAEMASRLPWKQLTLETRGAESVGVASKCQSLSRTHLELNLSLIKAAKSSLRSKIR